MKTSLIIEDELFVAAKKEAAKSGKTLSEVISYWARLGRDSLKAKKAKPPEFKAVDLGGPASIDLTNRRAWMETLDE